MKKRVICLILLLSAVQQTWCQQKVYMPFFDVINLQTDYQYSLSKLFQKYVADSKQYEIILPEWKNEKYPEENNGATQSKARDLSAPYYIKGSMNALGDLIIVTISMYQTDNGKELWNAFLKAAKIGDLDPILLTCARDLGVKNVTTTSNDIYTITSQDGQELREVETKISSGVLLGGLVPSKGKFSPGIGFLSTYDNRNIIYGLDLSIFFHQENIEGHIAITVDYPFSTSKNTVYAGGGLGYGFYSITDNTDPYKTVNTTNSGLMLMAGGGYIMNRTSSVRLIIGSRIIVPVFRVKDEFIPGIDFYLAVNISKRAKRKQTYDLNMTR